MKENPAPPLLVPPSFARLLLSGLPPHLPCTKPDCSIFGHYPPVCGFCYAECVQWEYRTAAAAWFMVGEGLTILMPMVCWSEIAAESNDGEGYRYTEAGIRTLLANLGQPSAMIHAIGGVADVSTADDFQGFLRAVARRARSGSRCTTTAAHRRPAGRCCLRRHPDRRRRRARWRLRPC